MLLAVGIISLVILCVGCAVFLGLAPDDRRVEPRKEVRPMASRFFVASAEPGVGREATLDLLLKDLQAHIQAEEQVAEGFCSRPDRETLRKNVAQSDWVN